MFDKQKEVAVSSSSPKDSMTISYPIIHIRRASHLFLVLFHVLRKTFPFFSSWRVPLEQKGPSLIHFIIETLLTAQFSPINKYVWCSIEVLCNTCRTMESDSEINYYPNNFKWWACLCCFPADVMWMLTVRARCTIKPTSNNHKSQAGISRS